MVYSQLDPARLHGAELTRWYLRSPADIERERQEATDQKYKDFFAPATTSPFATDRSQVQTQAMWRMSRQPSGSLRALIAGAIRPRRPTHSAQTRR